MSHIDPTLVVKKSEKKIIEDYGFHLNVDGNGGYALTDPVLKKADRKLGTYGGTILHNVLAEACRVRNEFEAKQEDSGTQATRDDLSLPPLPEQEKDDKVVSIADAKTTKKAKAKADAALNSVLDAVLPLDAPLPTPPDTIEDAELDNTGKRERNRKEKVIREKKDSRYLRVARVLLKDPVASLEKIMTEADVTEGTAGYSKEAFVGIRKAFEEAGLLRKPTKVKEANDAKPEAGPDTAVGA